VKRRYKRRLPIKFLHLESTPQERMSAILFMGSRDGKECVGKEEEKDNGGDRQELEKGAPHFLKKKTGTARGRKKNVEGPSEEVGKKHFHRDGGRTRAIGAPAWVNGQRLA